MTLRDCCDSQEVYDWVRSLPVEQIRKLQRLERAFQKGPDPPSKAWSDRRRVMYRAISRMGAPADYFFGVHLTIWDGVTL